MPARAKILLYAPAVSGGIAEYALRQADALQAAGADVVGLVAPGFLNGRRANFTCNQCLRSVIGEIGSGRLKRMKMAWRLVRNNMVLAWRVWQERPDLVLLDSYVEYLSPIWVWPHWILARVWGIRYAANLHDPVRDHQVGPAWWHRISVRLAYWPLDFVLVHERLPEPSPVPSGIRVAQVPHGLYEVSKPAVGPAMVRHGWGVGDGQKVFLAFGFVRDGKNLDLVVRALGEVPEAFLVVAGSVASPKDKSFAFYRELAEQLGVSARCQFFEGFVADSEVGQYFDAADFVILTYAATFHSQSGVLNVAARARKPVLASAAPGPMIKAVKDFQLGISVAPDSLNAVVTGMRQLLANGIQPDWVSYESYASWDTNARKILEAADLRKAMPQMAAGLKRTSW